MKNSIKKYMGISIAVCIGCAIIMLSGCKNLTDNKSTPDKAAQSSDNVSKSSEKALTSFAFKKDSNSWLKNDIVGAIDQASGIVRITVPEYAYKYDDPSKTGNRKFKASFTVSPKAKLYKGTEEQKSGALEDLFIENKEYKVVAEDGSKKIYKVHIKIEYTASTVTDAEAIKKFYGSYSGKLHFDNNYYDICVVYNQEKLISYSQAMSASYTNMQWTKVSETEWTCKTYSKKDLKRKTVKNTLTFKVGTDGKITCKLVVNAMGDAPSNEMEKGADYIWAPDDGKGFKGPTES